MWKKEAKAMEVDFYTTKILINVTDQKHYSFLNHYSAGGCKVVRVMSTTKLSSVTERDDCNSSGGSASSGSALVPVSYVKTRPTSVRSSKWGRLLGSSSLDSGTEVTAPAGPVLTRALSTTGIVQRRHD